MAPTLDCAKRLWIALWVFLSTATASGQTNLARGSPVDSSAEIWGGLQAASLTDGNPATFAHPLASSGTLGFYFEIDLGGTFKLDRILLRNRSDGCCPERLSNYRVELYADADGESGKLNWSAVIRANGSNSGTAGVDTVTAVNDPAGNFSGRFVRIVNANDAPYSPQIAEIEVYGGLPPRILSFKAEPDNILNGESATLFWEIAGASGATITGGTIGEIGTKGQVTVQPATTTLYTLVATNDAGSSSATVKVGVDVQLRAPEITEFMADNQATLKDEDGDNTDWIEIRNPNDFTLNLSGYSLTDDPQNAGKWVFPGVRIVPGGYFIVFASGKNRQNAASELHTNFRLDADGDYLALSDPNQRVVQEFRFPAQMKDASYGIGSDLGAGFFRASTPGVSNGSAFAGLVAGKKFSHDRGFYETNFLLTISCATADAVIRYSLNRSDVTATTGSIYTGPIPINGTTVLRAAAFKEGWAPTDIDTHTFIFPSNVIASTSMRTNITRHPLYAGKIKDGLLDIPSISLVTPRGINGTTETKTSVEWLPFGTLAGIQEDCGVRNFGGAFTTFAKKSFRLYFREEYGARKLRYPVFDSTHPAYEYWPPKEEFDQLELRSGSHDMVERGFYMSNVFTDDTLLEMGELNPHGRFVHLYLNGSYWGVYHLRERWGAAMHESYLGGARTNYESINGNWNVGGWAEPGTPYDGDGSTWTKVKELRSNYDEVKKLLDVKQYVDYMIVWLFGGSEDEYRCVGPNVPGSGFKFYLNDADGWFCGPWYCAAGNRTGRGAPGRSDGDGPGSIFSMLFKGGHPDYRVLLADWIHHALLNDGALTPGRNVARLLARTAEIERAFIAESARWNYLSPAEWANRRNHVLNTWFPARTGQVLSDFRAAGFYPTLDPPALEPSGGTVQAGTQVSFRPFTRGTIYFTLDGSDPRLPGGAVAPGALSYSSGRGGDIIVPAGATWRWFTDANGLGSSAVVQGHSSWSSANWKHPDFNHTSWKSGAAQLGYGEGDEATVIPFGPDSNRKWTTAYFRHRFLLAQTQDIVAAELRLKRDDGAIVYINGREALRSGMSSQPATGSTLAGAISDDGQGFNVFQIPLGLLLQGTNLVAVELHQASLTTTDASFDLELEVTRLAAQQSSNSAPRLNANTLVKARVKDGSTWSALTEAFYQVNSDPIAPGDLAITRLNYDNARVGAEFLELSNMSSGAINLKGVAFTDGIEFAFANSKDTLLAAGQKLVLVRDLFRFQQRYGLDVPLFGIYEGRLSDSGEIVRLEASSNIIASLHYQAAAPWPATTGNFSIVLAYPELGANDPSAWRLTALRDGAPGLSDTVLFTGNSSEDGDADGFPALLEFALGTDDLDRSSGPGDLSALLDSTGQLTFSFPRRLGADNVRLQCETSTDLVTWSRANLIATTYLSEGLARETWAVPASESRAQFMRLSLYRVK